MRAGTRVNRMGKLGGGSIIVLGIVIALLGILLMTDILDWLLSFAGFVLLVAGVIMVGVGVMSNRK